MLNKAPKGVNKKSAHNFLSAPIVYGIIIYAVSVV